MREEMDVRRRCHREPDMGQADHCLDFEASSSVCHRISFSYSLLNLDYICVLPCPVGVCSVASHQDAAAIRNQALESLVTFHKNFDFTPRVMGSY